MLILMNAQTSVAEDKPGTPAPAAAQAAPAEADHKAAHSFDEVADKALQAMKKRAEELDIKGVAVVAFAEGETVQAWSSKMVVVGHMTDNLAADKKGNNLLGIAYTKAAEMADTLKNSGSKVRPPMTGEYGWQGGLVAKGKSGIVIAAFSGGPSADDVKVSRAGLDILAGNL
jgi:hypothetical protein